MEIRGGEPGTVFSLFLLFCFIPLYFPFGLNKDCLAAGAEWKEDMDNSSRGVDRLSIRNRILYAALDTTSQ